MAWGDVHVLPVDDLIAHEQESEDCWCGPRLEPVERDDGSIGWVYVHHSADGREFAERGESIPKELP